MYTLEWLLNKKASEERVKYLFFWGHQPSKDGSVTSSCFSQWWPSPFTVDTITYKTCEHWMMAHKALLFDDKENYSKILLCESPAEAKKIGREIRNFDDAVWQLKRSEIVEEGNLHKFKQHEGPQAFLLATQDRVLVEASPVDQIWGIGLTADSVKASDPNQWNGLNLLGFALMEVRDILTHTKL